MRDLAVLGENGWNMTAVHQCELAIAMQLRRQQRSVLLSGDA
jgi:hypothetical protein